jgi:hypothetical protein
MLPKNILLALVVFIPIVVGDSQDALNVLQNSSDATYNPYFVMDVWETCFTVKHTCKRLLSKIHVRSEPSSTTSTGTRPESDSLLNLVENVLFVRSNENVNTLLSKYSSLFRTFLEVSSEYETLNSHSLDNVPKPLALWKTSIQRLSSSFIQQDSASSSSSSSDNTHFYEIHPLALNEMLFLLHKLHVHYLVNEISLFGLTIPRKFILHNHSNNNDGVYKKHDPKTQKRETTSSPILTTVQEVIPLNIKICSGNTYSHWNSQTNSYECICYADKNCYVNLQSISENETLHPLLILCACIIIILLLVRVYQATNPSIYL